MPSEYVGMIVEAAKSLELPDAWAMEGQEGEPAGRITLRYGEDMKIDFGKIEIHELLNLNKGRPPIEVLRVEIKRRIGAGQAIHISEE